MAPAKPSQARPLVWCIGGSDSGGGAGIQADLLTCHDLQTHACTLITALTAQNSQQVIAVNPQSVEVLQTQWDAMAQDLPADAIKIGLISTLEQLQWLVSQLAGEARPSTCPLVYDPVATASSGAVMAEPRLLAHLPALFPYLHLITPNRPELEALTGMTVDTPQQIMLAAQRLIQSGCNAVLVKGGHFACRQPWVIDYFTDGQQACWLVMPRIATPHGHGTGCTLASAISALLAQHYPLLDAVVLARSYLQRGLSHGYSAGQGPGPVAHAGWPDAEQGLPALYRQDPEMAPVAAMLQHLGATVQHEAIPQAADFAKISRPLGLYPVVDSVEWIARLLALGVKTVQLRVKDPHQANLEQQIIDAIALGRRYEARVFINDHWELALKHGAYGIHLGQEDLQVADLPRIAAAGVRLGVSTHGFFELALALTLRPSYVALGHIFPTQTKQMPSQPQGIQRLAVAVPLCREIPSVAIGGISVERVAQVLATGVGSVAVVSAITQAADPETVTLWLLQQLAQGNVPEVQHG